MSEKETSTLDTMSEKKRLFLFGGAAFLIVGVIVGLIIFSSFLNKEDDSKNTPRPEITTEVPSDGPITPEEDLAGADGYVPEDEFDERERQAEEFEDIKPEDVEAGEDHSFVFPGDYTFVETGMLEWCSIPAGQQWEDHLARFAPYFTADSKHLKEDLDSLLWERNCAVVSATEPELNEDGTYFLFMTLQRAWKLSETDEIAEGGMNQFRATFNADGIIDIQ